MEKPLKHIKKTEKLKNIIYSGLIILTGITAIIFAILYVDLFNSGIFKEYSSAFKSISVGVISVFTVLSLIFFGLDKNFIFKFCVLNVISITVLVVVIYILKASGFLDKIDSVEDLRVYIESYGGYAAFIFITIQFLQVVVLPVPGFITVGAGVLLFGALKGAIFSCLGIIAGSLVAFFIGKIFGYKAAKWLIGKENLDKWIKRLKGKDKIILTFMFLFPFFPDDILCFVAGISTISVPFFIIMIIVTRTISVFASSYSLNNSIIPYNTWWGILLWILFFLLTIVLTVIIYKKSAKY